MRMSWSLEKNSGSKIKNYAFRRPYNPTEFQAMASIGFYRI